MALDGLRLVLQAAMAITAIDIVLAWLQEDPTRFPRRLTHALTEPTQRIFRPLLTWRDWDLSAFGPLVLLGLSHALLLRLG